MSPEAGAHQALTRERLVEAALHLIQEDGLEGLSMRALAEYLEVRAASLYWHVRDRRELLELLADSILETVRPVRSGAGWRAATTDAAAALGDRLAGQKDARRILLEVPESLTRSTTYGELRGQLQTAGLGSAEASETALMIMAHVIASPLPADSASGVAAAVGSVASIAVDSGSRGVLLRAGSGMDAGAVVRTAHDRNGAAPAIVRGEKVVVRRLRGVGFGEIELNPSHPWTFQIQGGTWNTKLEVSGLEVRAIKLDSGATKVECFLPAPRGIVPIEISGGVVGVSLHRPPGVAVAAEISGGVVRLKLDADSFRATVSDTRWESRDGASAAPNRYQLRINSGAVQLSLDSGSSAEAVAVPSEPAAQRTGDQASALDILLDGVESRARG
ncbi:MAG TPA: TetR family transcriptional regulator [Candidatus Dormibacteraeota bacterium]|jgi:TetR/AcrR family tetracycline transcriptional repressor